MGIEPISIPLLVLFVIGLWKKPLHLLSLVSLTFFIGHFAIGHKEMRFLFPGAFAFIYVACIGLDYLLTRFTVRKGYKIVFRLLVAVNVAVLVFKMFTPAEEIMKYYRFIYCYAQDRPTTIISFGKSPYRMDFVECNFYKPRNMEIKVLQDTAALGNAISSSNGRDIIYLSDNLNPPAALLPYTPQRIYCEFPDWVLRNNINHWQERSYIWAIFKIGQPKP